jgi:hypothetical protein
METNTVVLSLQDYNQLREFKEKMEKGNTYKLPQPYTYGNGQWFLGQTYPATTYITTDEAVTDLLEKNKQLSEINEELTKENRELYNNKVDIKALKTMTIREFLRWRKTK